MESNQQAVCETIEHVASYISQYKLLVPGSRVVVGLSGGPDSVYLLYTLVGLQKSIGIQKVIAAHLDHQWRTDSYKDVIFCKQLAHQLGVPFITDTLSNYTQKITHNGSQEEIGRKARRVFLEKAKAEYNADAIALGHHKNDQIETFFIRLIRGTSLSGLCSIWPKKGSYIHPLLKLSKQEIIHYLNTYNIAYITDPSNESRDYLRNRIRHTVLPEFQNCDNRFEANTIATIARLQETELYLEEQAHQMFEQISHIKETKIFIDQQQLLNLPLIMQYRLLILWLSVVYVPFPITERFLQEILRFLHNNKSNTHHIHHNWYIKKNHTTMMIHIEKNNSSKTI